MSFCMHFGKWGRGLLREGNGERESGLRGLRAGVRIEILMTEQPKQALTLIFRLVLTMHFYINADHVFWVIQSLG